MATYNQPNQLPVWCPDNNANVVQPPASLVASGYTGNEVPMAEHINALFQAYGQWLGFLNQAQGAQVQAAAVDQNLRMTDGGNWSFNASTLTLSWDDSIYLSVPGNLDSENRIAPGSVVLGEDVVAYVQANIPLQDIATLTSGSTSVTGLQYTTGIVAGMAVSGSGIAANTTVASVGSGAVVLSAAATSTGQSTLLFVGSGLLSVQTSLINNLVPSANTIVIAFGKTSTALIGVNTSQMLIRDGEIKRFLGTGFVSTLRVTAGAALPANAPVYISSAADGRTLGQVYACDASAANGANRAQFVGFTMSAAAQGAITYIVSSGVLNNNSGLITGSIYYLDPGNVGGITATRPTTVGVYSVPIGLALTSTALRINPAATMLLQAITNNVVVAGDSNVGGAFSVVGDSRFSGTIYSLNSSNGNVLTQISGGVVNSQYYNASNGGFTSYNNAGANVASIDNVGNMVATGLVTAANLNVSGTTGANIVNASQISTASIVSAQGFKQTFSAGTLNVTNQTNSAWAYMLDASSINFSQPMPFGGSVMGVILQSVVTGSAMGGGYNTRILNYLNKGGATQTPTTLLTLAAAASAIAPNNASTSGPYFGSYFYWQIARGTAPFSAGDCLVPQVMRATDNWAFNGKMFIVVEFNS